LFRGSLWRHRLVAVLLTLALPAAVAGCGANGDEDSAPRDGCGTRPEKKSGDYWSCTFSDDFEGNDLDRDKWTPLTTAATGYSHSGECFVDRKKNIKVKDGTLRLTVRKVKKEFTCTGPKGEFDTEFTGGFITTWAKFQQTYGRFEFRAKFPAAQVAGLHSALWLWPFKMTYGVWPSSGEIDVAEFFTLHPRRVIPYIHYDGDKRDKRATNTKCVVIDPFEFHEYVLEWSARRMTIFIDGKVCVDNAKWKPAGLGRPAPFDHDFYINLTQALGRFGNAFDPNSTPLPATMEVDYVRAWK